MHSTLMRHGRSAPGAAVVVGLLVVGCSSAPSDVSDSSASSIVTPRLSNAIDLRMSPMGQRAQRALRVATHGSAFRVESDSCRNDPDCGDDVEFVDDGPNGGGQAEYSIAVDETSLNVVVGFNDTRGFSSSPISVSGFAWSDDGGRTFHDGGQLPSPGDQTIGTTKYPQVFGDAEVKYLGECTFIYSSILVKKFSDTRPVQTMGFHRSTDCGHTWEGPFEITGATNPSGVVNNGAPADAADKEFMDVDPATGRVILSWSNFTPSAAGGVAISTTYSDDILAATPTWSKAATVSAGPTDGQASIPRFAGHHSNEAYVAWRTFPGGNTNNVGFARSTDGGATWQAAIALSPAAFVTMDEVLGNDRINTSPSLAVDQSRGENRGSIYVVYANNDLGDGSDIVFQKSTDHGATFSAPVRLNARPGEDRAQWIPWVTVDRETGRVWVFYLDQGPAASGDLSQTTLTYSDDGGETWKAPRPLTERPFHAAWGNDTGQPNLGDYNQGVSLYGALYAVWAGTHPVGFADGEPASTSFTVPEMGFVETRGGRAMTGDLGTVTFTGAGGDGHLDPGDVAFFHVPIRNYVKNPLNAATIRSFSANLSTTTPGVEIDYADRRYPAILAGESAESSRPFVVRLDPSFVPGTDIEFELNVWSGPLTLHFTQHTGTPSPTVLFQEDFEAAAPGTLPAGWTPSHGGGANAVPWTTSNSFCNATSNGAFHVNANDGPTGGSPARFERLFSPQITVPADAEYVTVDLDVCYDTEDDPGFRVLAYDGALIRFTDFTTGHVLRSVLADAFASDFTTGDFFGYPKHLPRSSDTRYFQDMSAWAGDSGGVKHVSMRLPGMAGTTFQVRFEYTQDAGGICSDVRPGHACGVLVDNVVVSSVKSVVPGAAASASRHSIAAK